jgi:DNA-binding PucR family transcriptional regulator
MDGLSPDVRATLLEVASAVDAGDLSREIWRRLIDDIPELRGETAVEQVLGASVEENVATLLHILQHGAPRDGIRAPYAAIEYARRLAQRGTSMVALIRAYRLGHDRFLVQCIHELAGRRGDPGLSASVVDALITVSFQYIDQVSEQLITAYQEERDRWLLTQTAARAGQVRALLSGDDLDSASAEAALGYRLRQRHLGVVLWLIEPKRGSEGLRVLQRLTVTAANAVGHRGQPLFIPRDESSAWAWLPLPAGLSATKGELSAAFAGADASTRVAIGEPGDGIGGFRESHRQALRAQNVAFAARPGTQVTSFAEVGTIALLCADIASARSWVWATLGNLASNDEAYARLRDTLEIYLLTGSYTATASRLSLHKNTVLYRIRKAEEALAVPLEERHSDVELALRACLYLGEAVLRPTVQV